QAPGLHGRTFGIIGLGAIGLEVAHRVAALGMHLIAVGRPTRSPVAQEAIDRLRIVLVDTAAEVAAQADVVSFHVPLNDQTRGMIDGAFLATMQEESVLLNTSRGELVKDENELLAAAEAKRLRLGLDVFHDEPGAGRGAFCSAIARHPNVYGTHHVGASTEQAQQAVAAGIIEILEAHAAGVAYNAVNLLDASGTAGLVVRHQNKVGVLSAVLAELRQAGINVENMENRIFAGGVGAVASLALSEVPPEAVQAAIRAHEAVIGASVASRT
ncbi:MAG: NAD(P)-binding domain-containing protein, partial [Acidimicrobiia bacterium]|nr:NAD(P)-binding domain-containing protein [Acidimicrobiia bacterium]